MKLSKYLLNIIIISVVMFGIVPVSKADEDGSAVGQADKGWFMLNNVSGTPMYYGDVVYYASATTVNYGDDVRLGSQETALVAGVVMDSIVDDNEVGRIQVRGYHPDVRITGNDAITLGKTLIPSGWGLRSVNTTTDDADAVNYPFFVALETLPAHNRNGTSNNETAPASQEAVKCIINLR